MFCSIIWQSQRDEELSVWQRAGSLDMSIADKCDGSEYGVERVRGDGQFSGQILTFA